jgi:8-oxo-dGTP pyrophosphatase MutT (NUDIX family)
MLRCLTENLASHVPRTLDGKERQSAVAIVLCDEAELDVLFIHRAIREGDPWSGHLAFPGGRIEPGDRDPQAAAERETREELGLDLTKARRLGQLDDLTGVTIPVCVSAFTYLIGQKPVLEPNDEVEDSFWYPLADLADPDRRVTRPFRVGERERNYPGVDLRLAGKPMMWGLTYRFCLQILSLAGLEQG